MKYYCYVVHDFYGCESGCCGHRVYLCEADGSIVQEKFEFEHYDDDYETPEEFVRRRVD